MLLDCTTFYYPGKGSRLRMIDYLTSGSDLETSEEEKEENNLVDDTSASFIGVNPGDLPYESWINFENEEMNLEPKIGFLNNHKLSALEEIITKRRSPMLYIRKESEPVEVKAEIIFRWCNKKIPIRMVANELEFDPQKVKNIIYEFRTLRRITKKMSKSVHQRRDKLNQSHHESLSKFVELKGIRGFTRHEARSHLLNKFPSLNNIDVSSVGRALHQTLGLSFKKLGGTNIKKQSSRSKENLQRWAKLVINLLLQQHYLVFVDEFKINRSTQRTYGWTKRGKPGRLLIRSPDLNMSFVVAHSQTRLEGIMGTKSTFNQIKYKIFLEELIGKLKATQNLDWSKLMIIAYNWVFHRTNLIKDFMIKNKLRCLFIPAYSPEINAWEKLINYIKSKVKILVSEQR